MNNNIWKNVICKNKQWFYNMYNLKLEELHSNNKKNGGSILNYIDYNDFINKYKNLLGKKYFEFNITNISFLTFYGNSFKESIFFKIIKDIDENFDNTSYTYKDSFLYDKLKEDNIKTLSDYFKLNEPNNLQKYSKFYEFYPWKNEFQVKAEKYCGIYSDNVINMHFIKFKRTLESIKKYGIKYNIKNMILGTLFKKNNEKKLIITSGTHRIIILKYLLEIKRIDEKDIICQVNNSIDLSNINNWYYVKNKFISKENAEKIFNNFFKY